MIVNESTLLINMKTVFLVIAILYMLYGLSLLNLFLLSGEIRMLSTQPDLGTKLSLANSLYSLYPWANFLLAFFLLPFYVFRILNIGTLSVQIIRRSVICVAAVLVIVPWFKAFSMGYGSAIVIFLPGIILSTLPPIVLLAAAIIYRPRN